MITISREVIVKIGKHAWHVYPLEAFGYLLGNSERNEVLVALPYSKTSRWYVYDDRWIGIEEQLPKAEHAASDFGLDVVGFYCSTADHGGSGVTAMDYPIPPFLDRSSMGLMCIYDCLCCTSCSSTYFRSTKGVLSPGEDYRLSKQKRAIKDVNQRRVHSAWLRSVGQIDYSNGSVGIPHD
jgi:hypothetical protein